MAAPSPRWWFDSAVRERLHSAARLLRSPSGAGGPVAATVLTSLRRALLYGLVSWNVVLAAVAVVIDPRVPAAVLVAVHLGAAVMALLAIRGRFAYTLCLVLNFGIWILDYLGARSADDALTLAACWLGNLLFLGAALTLPGRLRTWLPIGGASVTVAVIVRASPVWDLQVASAFVVTAIAIVLAVRSAAPALWRLADDADADAARLAEEVRLQEAARLAGAEAAEDSRVMHDTVINTLGAIANGGSSVRHQELVAERCRRDYEVVQGLLDGRPRTGRDLAELLTPIEGLKVRLQGSAARELEELQDQLAPEVLDAVVSAAAEALRNVAKHSGVATANLRVERLPEMLMIEIVDMGSGISPDDRWGTGLRDSVVARIDAVGGTAVVDSSPGQGTRVRIGVPLVGRTLGPDVAVSLDPQVVAQASGEISRALVRRGGWLMSVGVVAVGLLIEPSNRPGQLTWTYAMLLLTAIVTALAWFGSRGRPDLPGWAEVLLVLALPVGFVLAFAGVDFGRTDVMYFQAIGIVPMLMILLSLGHRRSALLGGGLVAATAIAFAVGLGLQSAGYAAVVVVAALPALGLGIGWALFVQLADRVVAEAETVRRQVLAAALDAEAQREIAVGRRRWGTAGLERSAALLRGIADGDLDVEAPEVQRACAAEEEYLRQLLLISPAAYRVSVWFAQALARARVRGVRLVIRSGDQDAPDARAAALIGVAVTGAVEHADPGDVVTVGWFPGPVGPRLVLVHPDRGGAAGVPKFPGNWEVSSSVIEQRKVLEVGVS